MRGAIVTESYFFIECRCLKLCGFHVPIMSPVEVRGTFQAVFRVQVNFSRKIKNVEIQW